MPDDISYKGTGWTTRTTMSISNEMGQNQGAQTGETMKNPNIYHHVENKVSADNPLETKEIKAASHKMLEIQRDTMNIRFEKLEHQIQEMEESYNAQIKEMNESHDAKIKQMEQLHNSQVSLYKTHGLEAIEKVVNEVDQLRARVAQLSNTIYRSSETHTQPLAARFENAFYESLSTQPLAEPSASDFLQFPSTQVQPLNDPSYEFTTEVPRSWNTHVQPFPPFDRDHPKPILSQNDAQRFTPAVSGDVGLVSDVVPFN